MLFKTNPTLENAGLTILRVVFGIIFVMHGSQKLFGAFGGGGIDGTTVFLGSLGFAPAGFWAWLLALVEFIGGLALTLGLLTQLAAILIVINMVVAIITVRLANGFFAAAGGYEFELTLLALAVYFTVAGGGQWALDKMMKRSPKPMMPNQSSMGR